MSQVCYQKKSREKNKEKYIYNLKEKNIKRCLKCVIRGKRIEKSILYIYKSEKDKYSYTYNVVCIKCVIRGKRIYKSIKKRIKKSIKKNIFII